MTKWNYDPNDKRPINPHARDEQNLHPSDHPEFSGASIEVVGEVYQGEPGYYELVSEDSLEFEDQFDPEVVSDVLHEIVLEKDNPVWTPDLSDSTIDISANLGSNAVAGRVQVLQVIHGRVFIKEMDVVIIDSKYYVQEEQIG